MNLEETFSYKNKLMEHICTNKNIVRLITKNEEAYIPNHNLAYTQVFPCEWVPDTLSDSNTYICFDVDITSVPSKTYYLPVMYIWVFTHKSNLRAPKEFGGGITTDRVVAEIDRMLNGNRFYGLGDLKLSGLKRFTPITGYHGRVLIYSAKDFNRPSGRIYAPSNRMEGR